MIDRLTTRQVRKLADLTLAEWRVVAHLAAIGNTSSARISKAALVDRAEISRAVRSLAEKGLIARQSNPADQRVALLELTEKGRELFETTQRERISFFADLTDQFSPDELQQLDDYLFRIAKVADQMLEDSAAAS
ncbi:MarR family winged helix-turn-helix transcriptional regulator [Aurantiacibacter flavus]|uniref:MarR family transcriptional regulator n=1 Tax=Aurantiacibacter flavus TaxID=3145232 RepID=A0ABV0CZI3_9SPHN